MKIEGAIGLATARGTEAKGSGGAGIGGGSSGNCDGTAAATATATATAAVTADFETLPTIGPLKIEAAIEAREQAVSDMPRSLDGGFKCP